MSTAKSSFSLATTSTRSLCFALCVITLLMVSAQFDMGDCRVLRSTTTTTTVEDRAVTGCNGADQSEAPPTNSVPVSSNNATNNSSSRDLAFTLASGPSRRGPGHWPSISNSTTNTTSSFFFLFLNGCACTELWDTDRVLFCFFFSFCLLAKQINVL